MCATEKKINEFILFYWKMKKKIYSLPVGGTNEKKNRVKKKKASAGEVGWATAHF